MNILLMYQLGRHDRSIRASALNIREAYAVAPMSPSAFVVDLTPDTPVQLIAAESHHASSDDGHDFPSVSTWTSTPSVILPLERYRRDSQRHEQLAVSVCFGRTCELVLTDESVSDCAVFQRSLAPSPSTRRGLELSAGHLEGVHDSISTRSVVDLEDDDYQTYLRTYSLVRWFGATMEKTQELAIELQQDTVHPSRKEHASYRGPISCAVTIPSGCEPDRDSPSSSISLDRIEPDLALGAGGEEPSTDECLEAHKAAYKMYVSPLARDCVATFLAMTTDRHPTGPRSTWPAAATTRFEVAAAGGSGRARNRTSRGDRAARRRPRCQIVRCGLGPFLVDRTFADWCKDAF
jgi:hypothetical protein